MKGPVRVTLAFLFLAAGLGIILRLVQAGVPIHNYKYLLHTHSHIALLGWVYNGAFILLELLLVPSGNRTWKKLFWVTQITFFGMLISFPIQGYGAISITFSTLYLFCSYYLVYLILKKTDRSTPHSAFLRWGGIYLVLSSLGPYILGYLMAKALGNTQWYNLSIYWFLHFLYNGFFTLVIVAFALRNHPSLLNKQIFRWTNASVLPLFALSTLWTKPHNGIYLLALMGALLQVLSLVIFLKGTRHSFFLRNQPGMYLPLCFTALCLKLFFQVAACFRPVQQFINATIPFSVIGFIHLVMIGFFTFFLLGIFNRDHILTRSKWLKSGDILLVTGFIGSELLLFGQSLFSYFGINLIPNFFMTLSIVSALMPLGIIFILYRSFQSSN